MYVSSTSRSNRKVRRIKTILLEALKFAMKNLNVFSCYCLQIAHWLGFLRCRFQPLNSAMLFPILAGTETSKPCVKPYLFLPAGDSFQFCLMTNYFWSISSPPVNRN